MKYVQILTSRPIGRRCKLWAEDHLPEGWDICHATDVLDEGADVVISVLFEDIIQREDFIQDVRYYNFHPGVLPQYAGSGCLSWAILNGEHEAGISLHVLIPEVDAGDIIEIRKFPIMNSDTAESLFGKAEEFIWWMFTDRFHDLLLGDMPTTPQDMSKRQVYRRRDLNAVKDQTATVRALTFNGKENAYFFNRNGERIELVY